MWNCCKQCGALLEDDAKVCPYCGKTVVIPKVEPAPKPVPKPKPAPLHMDPPAEEPAEIADPIPKFSLWIPTTKQKFIIAGVLLVIILIGVGLYQHFFTAVRAVNKYEAVVNGEVEQLRSLAPDEYWEILATNNGCTIEEYVDKRADKLMSDYAAAQLNGSLVSARFTIKEETDLDYFDRQRIGRELEDKYGIGRDRVTAATELVIQVRVYMKKRNTQTSYTAIAVQIDSQWYLLRHSTLTNDYYFIADGTLSTFLPKS